MSKDKRGPIKTVLGFLAGAISGATLGLLMAPKAGKETREDLKAKSEELVAAGKKDFAKKSKELKVKVDEVTKNFEKGIERLKSSESQEAISPEPKEEKGAEKPKKETAAKKATPKK
ncbi:MAG: YtxH domain-containing protein [Actinomycetota bacterium]|nr:YtxH domain-containing protein [Actinomycetota bacterium]